MTPEQRGQLSGEFRGIGRLAAGMAKFARAFGALAAVGVMRLPATRAAGAAAARIVAGWALRGTQGSNQLVRKYLTARNVGRKARLMSR